jgi:hypothetical protein
VRVSDGLPEDLAGALATAGLALPPAPLST